MLPGREAARQERNSLWLRAIKALSFRCAAASSMCALSMQLAAHLFGAARRRNARIVIEVLAQLDAHRVRGIALTPTQGWREG